MTRPKKTAKTATKTLEQRLWDAADALRGNQEPSEYKHVVLGLVFLKYISDRFEARYRDIEAALSDPDSDDYIPNETRRLTFLEDRDEYRSHNVFWVPTEARWESIQAKAKLPEIGQIIDTAMDLIEKENRSVKGVLPRNYGREGLDKGRPGQLVDLIGSIGFTEADDHGSDDVLGRVYEYFLGQFAGKETGKDAGAFYTPRSVVKILVEMLEPYRGRVYDPACGSGGMFVQSAAFVKAHGGKRTDISVYGQEFTDTTWKLAKMNLALRGIEADLGDRSADSFSSDLHPDLRADFVIANPPFNVSNWWDAKLADDPRWSSGRRRRATPTTRGCSTSFITCRRKAPAASSLRTGRSVQNPVGKAIFDASSSRRSSSTASLRCPKNCSSTRAFRSACGSCRKTATATGTVSVKAKCYSSTRASLGEWRVGACGCSTMPISRRSRIRTIRGGTTTVDSRTSQDSQKRLRSMILSSKTSS
jgi:N-6 DNA Methylase/HsdM N-terminal domain